MDKPAVNIGSKQQQRQTDPQQHTKRRIRSIARLFPAESRHEFHSVGRSLLAILDDTLTTPEEAHTTLSIEQALEYVSVWRQRQPRLPHAIESTAALSELIWRHHHHHHHHRTSGATPVALQHALSAAILRSVNGLADTLQQHRSTAASVSVLCESLGIPSWLVDVRHQATHQVLPSLSVLVLAASTLLRYFCSVYWDPLRESQAVAYERARSLLQAYADDAECCRNTAAITPQEAEEEEETTGTTTTTPKEPSKDVDNAEKTHEKEEQREKESILDRLIPKLGSNTNRFALLMDEKKKKKRKKKQEVEEEEEDFVPLPKKKQHKPVKKREPAPQTSPPPTTPTSCARDYIKADIPIDIAYEVAIDFVVLDQQKKRRLASTSSYYRTLVTELTNAWPGFLGALRQDRRQKPEEIQALLLELDPTTGSSMQADPKETAVVPTKRKPKVWQRCVEWEPCGLGQTPTHYR